MGAWIMCYMLMREEVVQCEHFTTEARCLAHGRTWYTQALAWTGRNRLSLTEPMYTCFPESLIARR